MKLKDISNQLNTPKKELDSYITDIYDRFRKEDFRYNIDYSAQEDIDNIEYILSEFERYNINKRPFIRTLIEKTLEDFVNNVIDRKIGPDATPFYIALLKYLKDK